MYVEHDIPTGPSKSHVKNSGTNSKLGGVSNADKWICQRSQRTRDADRIFSGVELCPAELVLGGAIGQVRFMLESLRLRLGTLETEKCTTTSLPPKPRTLQQKSPAAIQTQYLTVYFKWSPPSATHQTQSTVRLFYQVK